VTGRGRGVPVLLDNLQPYAETIAHWVAKGREAFLDPGTGSQGTIERQFEQFEEAATRLGASFQEANPGIASAPIFEIRNEISHPYEHHCDRERLGRFVRDDFPAIARELRRPNFPTDAERARD
jgi:uncharacterized protein with HEPN domain